MCVYVCAFVSLCAYDYDYGVYLYVGADTSIVNKLPYINDLIKT